MTTPDHDALVQCLEEAAWTPAPAPREAFVRRLEARLVARAAGEQDVVEAARPARRSWTLAPVAAMAAAVALVVAVVSGGDGGGRRVDTADEPSTAAPVGSSTSAPPVPTTAPSVVTTVAPPATAPPPTTAPVPVRPGPTTTTPSRPTTTVAPAAVVGPPQTVVTAPPTVPPAPTTTAVPALEALELACRAGTVEGGPAVTCSWSASTSSEFAGYRLLRKANGVETKVLTTADRGAVTFIDTAVVPGTSYTYWVEAKSRAGLVIGRGGPVTVLCCGEL